jgi:alkylhydroperoxidase family enzyme
MAFIELGDDDGPNSSRAFAARPAVLAAWQQLNGAIKESGGDLRRYELATLAAARRLRSSYCCLAHGKVLAEQFYDFDAVPKLPGGLDETDVAIMELADKVVVDATSITEADWDKLRALGLDDAQITDVVLAAAARCFFSKALDALGVQADASFRELDPAFRDAMTVGRPIAPA